MSPRRCKVLQGRHPGGLHPPAPTAVRAVTWRPRGEWAPELKHLSAAESNSPRQEGVHCKLSPLLVVLLEEDIPLFFPFAVGNVPFAYLREQQQLGVSYCKGDAAPQREWPASSHEWKHWQKAVIHWWTECLRWTRPRRVEGPMDVAGHPADSFCRPVVQCCCSSTNWASGNHAWIWVLWKIKFACKRARGLCSNWEDAPAWHKEPHKGVGVIQDCMCVVGNGYVLAICSQLDSHLHRSSQNYRSWMFRQSNMFLSKHFSKTALENLFIFFSFLLNRSIGQRSLCTRQALQCYRITLYIGLVLHRVVKAALEADCGSCGRQTVCIAPDVLPWQLLHVLITPSVCVLGRRDSIARDGSGAACWNFFRLSAEPLR